MLPATSRALNWSSRFWLQALILALVFCCQCPGTCLAAATYTLTQTQSNNFGTLMVPGSGSQTCVIPEPNVCPCAGGSCGTGTGTPLYGNADDGCWNLRCVGSSCGGSISLSVSASPGGCSGWNGLSPSKIWYNSGAVICTSPCTVTAPANGQTFVLCIGATATYNSAASAGTCSAGTLTIDVASGALVSPYPVSLAFDKALSTATNSQIAFGNVKAATASTYTISTAGAVSVTAGAGAFYGGPTSAGSITISGSSTDLINISAGGFTANNGVTPANPTCAYNGGPSGSCAIGGAAAPGGGKILLVGVDAIADGTQADGVVATPSFTLTVGYQ